MVSSRFRKGDLVVVEENGSQVVFEILSSPVTDKRLGKSEETCYDAKQIMNGSTRTIFEDEILRLATPVDSSAQLFRKKE